MEVSRYTVGKYYAYRAMVSIGFMTPIWYIYVLEEVSYASMGVLDALWWLCLLLFEMPTGYISDVIGRKEGLIISSLVVGVSMIGMAVADGFWEFAVIYVVWPLGLTFRSGSDDAWLYDTLLATGETDRFSHVRGRGNTVSLIATGASALAGGYIAQYDSELTFLLSSVVLFASILLLLTLPRTEDEAESADYSQSNEDDMSILNGVKESFSSGQLRAFVIYLGVVNAVFWGVNFFIQPVSVDLGLNKVHLGWMFAAFTAIGSVVNYNTERIRDAVGIDGWFSIAPLIFATLFIFTAFTPLLAFAAFFAMRSCRDLNKSLANQFINDRVESVGRATALSGAGMIYTLFIIPFELAAGGLADTIGPVKTIGLFGALLLSGTVILRLIDDPFGEKYDSSD